MTFPRIVADGRLLPDDRRRPSAQDELLDLAGRRLGELFDEVEPLGDFEVGEPGSRKASKLRLGRGLTGLEDEEGTGRLAPALVREADHRHFLDRGMAK